MAQRRQHRCERCKQPHREQGALCATCGTWERERYDRARGTPSERGYDHRWRLVRAEKMRRDPLCQRCKAAGKTVAADTVHHIDELTGSDDMNRLRWINLESLCRPCHERHHGRRK